jgi:hypothetical protein
MRGLRVLVNADRANGEVSEGSPRWSRWEAFGPSRTVSTSGKINIHRTWRYAHGPQHATHSGIIDRVITVSIVLGVPGGAPIAKSLFGLMPSSTPSPSIAVDNDVCIRVELEGLDSVKVTITVVLSFRLRARSIPRGQTQRLYLVDHVCEGSDVGERR